MNIYFNFWKSIKDEFTRYEDGVKEALVAVLCSPEFLFIAEPSIQQKGTPKINEFQLANRLSYFLWNQPPDKRLLDLAYSLRLSTNLDKEIDRMIQDPKSDKFVATFTKEWLRLDRHEDMTINVKIQKYKDLITKKNKLIHIFNRFYITSSQYETFGLAIF